MLTVTPGHGDKKNASFIYVGIPRQKGNERNEGFKVRIYAYKVNENPVRTGYRQR